MTIKQRQHLLAYLGYYEGNVDGDWGSISRDACIAFQRDADISPDGQIGPVTEQELKKAVANDRMKPEPEKKEGQTGTFWDEIEFFDREEFRCKCGGRYCSGYPAEPKEQLVRIANQLRKNLGVPVTIVSGLRCPTHNANEGGVDNSQHMYGEAADVCAHGVSQAAVEAELDRIGGVRYHYPIKNSNNVHFDIPKVNR